MFVAIYTVEAILKILALGPTTYFNSGWNVFDFCVTLSSIGGIFGELLHASFYYIVVLRPLRLLRLFKIKKRYRDVMDTLFVLLPRMVSVAIVLLIMYYFFAIIGMECFSEIQLKNCCKNTSVEAFYSYRNTTPETQYLNKYFYLNNFENILASYVTLFELTIINNWHITMEAVYIVTSRWSRIYFMLFYISSMVVITIAIAFILEAFLFRMQYQITVIKSREQKDTLEERMVEVDIPLTKSELENNFPRYLADLDLASLHQQLSQVESLTFRGLRGTTKADLSCIMYRDEVKTWIAEEEAKGKADLRHFLHRLTSQQSVQQIETAEGGEEEEAETNSTHQTAVVV
ncbi:two pore channel protein 1-like [Glandiceps talaboti]